jgi:hypothetical protein
VWSVGEALGLAEMPTGRTLKELVELGLLSVGQNPGQARAELDRFATSVGASFEPVAIEVDLHPAPARSADEENAREAAAFSAAPSLADSILIDSSAASNGNGNGNGNSTAGAYTDQAFDRPTFSPSAFAGAEPDEADEVARQLAALSPQAARAVAAAAQASTDEEREAALAEVNDEDEPINRGLLLKFLSSVRS